MSATKDHFNKITAESWNVKDEYKSLTLKELKEIYAKEALPFTVCAVNVLKDLNLGIMMRTACLMGAERFIVYGKHGYDRRSTVGAQNYIPVITAGSIDRGGSMEIDYSHFMPLMTTYRLSPICFDTDGIPLKDLDMNKYDRPCLIFGNEGFGIPNELKEKCGTVVSIPQRGVLRSLNVSSAASIAIHHFSSHLSK